MIDEADPISQAYWLEVSSAGLGRKMTKDFHFEAKKGEEALAKMIRPTEDGMREIRGTIVGCTDGVVTLDCEGTLRQITLKDTSFVKLTDDENLF
jgi:ribosome maturation factor RimP